MDYGKEKPSFFSRGSTGEKVRGPQGLKKLVLTQQSFDEKAAYSLS